MAAGTLPWQDEKYGPLPALLLIFTLLTGLVDAISYLGLGQVFVANMTGNVVFLGFALAGASGLSFAASLVALLAFLAGAAAGGRLGTRLGGHRGRLLAITVYVKIALVGAAFAMSLAGLDYNSGVGRYAFIILLGLSMGMQNATARRLGVPDLTTTVLTLSLTGLAADSTLAGGKNPNPGRRVVAALTMFAGAAIGALLMLRVGISAVLALGLALLVLTGIAAYRLSSSTEAWAVGA
jgi:uncharacterized membrane protein YoaK (UPF0700 family)